MISFSQLDGGMGLGESQGTTINMVYEFDVGLDYMAVLVKFLHSEYFVASVYAVIFQGRPPCTVNTMSVECYSVL